MAKPGVEPEVAPPVTGIATGPPDGPQRPPRICMAILKRHGAQSRFRIVLFVLVFVGMIGSLMVTTTAAYSYAHPELITEALKENGIDGGKLDTDFIQLYMLMLAVLGSVHLAMSVLPIAAECKDAPRLFLPWIGFQYFMVLTSCAHTIKTSINSAPTTGHLDDVMVGIIITGYHMLTALLSRARKLEMELDTRHAILIES